MAVILVISNINIVSTYIFFMIIAFVIIAAAVTIIVTQLRNCFALEAWAIQNFWPC